MKLLAAVADSAERAIENTVMVLDNSSSVKGNFSLIYFLVKFVVPRRQRRCSRVFLGLLFFW